MTNTTRRALLVGAAIVLAAAAIVVLATSSCACRRSNPVAGPATRGHTPSKPVRAAASAAQPPPRSTACAPVAGQTMSNTVSHVCGFADTTNTGVPAGTRLYRVPQDVTGPLPDGSTGSGWSWSSGSGITLNSGAVLKSVVYTGGLAVRTSNVTVEDSDITTSGENSWAISLWHASSPTIRNNNLHGTGSMPGNGCDAGVRDIYNDSTHLVLTGNNIWFCATGLNNYANGGSIERNYIHDFAFTTAAAANHFDGIQLEVGNGAATLLQDNTIVMSPPQTAPIILSNDYGGTETNRTISHNLLAGGGYCFYGGANPKATKITFTANSFSRLYHSTCGMFGFNAYWTSGSDNVWSGNIWDDTGAPVQPQ